MVPQSPIAVDVLEMIMLQPFPCIQIYIIWVLKNTYFDSRLAGRMNEKVAD